MKFFTSLLVVVFLTLAAAAAGAETLAASPETAPAMTAPAATPAVASPEATAQLAPDASCPTDGQALIIAGTPDSMELAGRSCGPCSTGGCNGAPRGQICYISGQGWSGHCNIFSGGYMCPTGGWDCQCQAGDLP